MGKVFHIFLMVRDFLDFFRSKWCIIKYDTKYKNKLLCVVLRSLDVCRTSSVMTPKTYLFCMKLTWHVPWIVKFVLILYELFYYFILYLYIIFYFILYYIFIFLMVRHLKIDQTSSHRVFLLFLGFNFKRHNRFKC